MAPALIKDTSGPKEKVTKKPIKRRILEKVTQEYVLGFLKTFMIENQNLLHLDLTNTGLDEWGVIEVAQLLKQYQGENPDISPTKLRNLAGLHLSFPDTFNKKKIVSEINALFNPGSSSNNENEEIDRATNPSMLTEEEKKQRHIHDLA